MPKIIEHIKGEQDNTECVIAQLIKDGEQEQTKKSKNKDNALKDALNAYTKGQFKSHFICLSIILDNFK